MKNPPAIAEGLVPETCLPAAILYPNFVKSKYWSSLT
jgi:hypothetical protein